MRENIFIDPKKISKNTFSKSSSFSLHNWFTLLFSDYFFYIIEIISQYLNPLLSLFFSLELTSNETFNGNEVGKIYTRKKRKNGFLSLVDWKNFLNSFQTLNFTIYSSTFLRWIRWLSIYTLIKHPNPSY